MAKHKIRDYLEQQLAACKKRRESPNPKVKKYSPRRFVIERLLEFPFEKYPDYAYPGHLLMHEPMRWGHIEQVIRFCELLKQPKGSRAGEPVRLLGFQVLIIACILGPEDPDTRLRLVRTAIMTIARKNGKSSLVSMIYLALMSLGCFNLKAQDIQVGAADREQAGILFDLMQKLILLDTDLGLNDLYHIIPSKKTIANKRTYTRLHCLSSDAYRAHGANPMSVLLDEFGNIPDGKAREFYSVLSTAFGSQQEPLLLQFSTQAPVDSHVFSEFVERARKANLDEDADPGLCGILFELPKTKPDGIDDLVLLDDGKTVDHFAEKNWVWPNPALEGLSPGGFRSLADLRAKAKEARNMPSMENAFRNLQLNQRISAIAPFISQAAWSAVEVPPDSIDEEILEESPCCVALDLSARRDLTARASVWVLEGGRMYARVRFYTPQEGLSEKSKQDKVPLNLWADQGFVAATPGKLVDYAFVADELRDHSERYPIEAIGFDRWRIEELVKECDAVGFAPYEAESEDFWRPIGQGFRDQNVCVEQLEAAVVDGKISVEHNPALTWCMSNAVTVTDPAGSRKFEKSKSYGRIDGTVALAMAVWLATQQDLDDRAGIGESVYEDDDHGLLVL